MMWTVIHSGYPNTVVRKQVEHMARKSGEVVFAIYPARNTGLIRHDHEHPPMILKQPEPLRHAGQQVEVCDSMNVTEFLVDHTVTIDEGGSHAVGV